MNMEKMTGLIACLAHAARNKKSAMIGGGQFDAPDLLQACHQLNAAPDLFAVAVSVSTMKGQDGEPTPLARDALAAIAKAKGGAA